MSSNFGKDFDFVLHHIRKNFSPNCGLSVKIRWREKLRWHDGERIDGVTNFYPGCGWTILIDAANSASGAIEVLCHEWAHILHDERYGYNDDTIAMHSDEWGVIYATIYRSFWTALEERRDGKKTKRRRN